MNYFAGTAERYARYRQSYPDQVWDTLAVAAAVSVETSLVVDLGCGPGTASLPLARRSRRVVAVDADEAMIAVGRRLAEAVGINNVDWRCERAEELQLDDGTVQLVVAASSFHWMDRPAVAAACKDMLTDTGLFATIGLATPLMQIEQRDGVGAPLAEVWDRWLGTKPYVFDLADIERPEVVLEQAGFSEVTIDYVPHRQRWTIERFVGFLGSTSARPDLKLGRDFDTYVADIDAAIRSVEPSGEWEFDVPLQVITGRR